MSGRNLRSEIDTEGGLYLTEDRADLLLEKLEDDRREKEEIVEEYRQLEREYEAYKSSTSANRWGLRLTYAVLGFLLGLVVYHVF